MRILPLALLLAGAAAAADYPASAGYVNDFTGTLPDAVQQALELRVRAFERATSDEIAVAIMPSLQGQSLEEYAHGLYHSWKIGEAGLNTGVLFLWVPSEHKSRHRGRVRPRQHPHGPGLRENSDPGGGPVRPGPGLRGGERGGGRRDPAPGGGSPEDAPAGRG